MVAVLNARILYLGTEKYEYFDKTEEDIDHPVLGVMQTIQKGIKAKKSCMEDKRWQMDLVHKLSSRAGLYLYLHSKVFHW